ncbi:MAG: nitroreductase family protein, partial [Culicoidibacterales bacterium]
SEKEFQELITQALKNAPSAMNSQATRLIVLSKQAHQQHWDKVEEQLAKVVPPEKFKKTAKKIEKFRAAYATILFFEDYEIVEKLELQYPLYAQKYRDWSHQSNAMLQYALWIGFEAKGLGVSIQHYNPLIDEMVQTHWQAPASWKLITEMVVGNPTAPAGEKIILPLENRLQFIDHVIEIK